MKLQKLISRQIIELKLKPKFPSTHEKLKPRRHPNQFQFLTGVLHKSLCERLNAIINSTKLC